MSRLIYSICPNKIWFVYFNKLLKSPSLDHPMSVSFISVLIMHFDKVPVACLHFYQFHIFLTYWNMLSGLQIFSLALRISCIKIHFRAHILYKLFLHKGEGIALSGCSISITWSGMKNVPLKSRLVLRRVLRDGSSLCMGTWKKFQGRHHIFLKQADVFLSMTRDTC